MSRPGHTLQRLERILTMVPWLLDHPGVTIGEISERFAVEPEELTQDLDILGYCGLPGYGGGDLVEVSIVGDRVAVRMADFFARPLTLSMREAVTLLLAGRALASVEGLVESDALARAVATLESALGADAARVAVDLRTEGDQWLPAARQAVDAGRVVHLVYRSASKAETTQRDVEPWAVVGHAGAWYLQGYCRLAQAPRDFRLDRVREMAVTTERAAPVPEQPPAPVYRPDPDDIAVTLDLQPPAWWVAEWAVIDADTVDRKGRRRITLRTPSLEWAARLVLRLGGDAAIVDPPQLRERVGELVEATLDGYGKTGA